MSDASDRDLLVRIDERVEQMRQELFIGTPTQRSIKGRVEDLEDRQSYLKGWVAAIGTGFGVIWSSLEWVLHHRSVK